MKWPPHTRIKLKLLENYFDICRHYHKDDPRKFYYVDTHAGDGYAEFSNEKTLGSPLMAIEKGFQCFLLEKNDKLYKRLDDNINSFLSRNKRDPEQKIILHNQDCNVIIEEILKKVPPYYHSLFFLDPFAPKDLRWNTVQQIIEHEHKYKSPKDMSFRRPELIINFPISGIKRIAGKLKDEETDPGKKKTVEHVTTFFGGTKWKEIWKKYEIDKDKGAATSEQSRDALKNHYIGKFKEYYRYFHTVLVTDFQRNLPLYYLIYFTNKHLGSNKMRKIIDEIDEWRQTTYIHEVYDIIPLDEFYRVKDVDKSIQMPLDVWMKKTQM